jgi:hypothetical protein
MADDEPMLNTKLRRYERDAYLIRNVFRSIGWIDFLVYTVNELRINDEEEV